MSESHAVTLPLIIEGPTVNATFFIRDSQNHTWDGTDWGYFNVAEEWSDFKSAFIAAGRLKDTMTADTTERN